MDYPDRPKSERIADAIADDIVTAALSGRCQILSLQELSERYGISPSTATATTGSHVRKGVLERRRNLGMFVTPGTHERIIRERTSDFENDFVKPMLAEGIRLEYSLHQVSKLIATRIKS